MNSILTPILALVVWSLIVWAWMLATRIPAMQKAKFDPQGAAHTTALHVLPSRVRAVADNYNHLMEQPTLFYGLVIYLHLTAQAGPINIMLAWGYVALRVVHSLVQNTANIVALRFILFVASTLMLVILTARAVWALF